MTRERDTQKRAFIQFKTFFPNVEMPVTLGEQTHHVFSTKNKPLPEYLIAEFILPIETENVDEYTEFVPCFSFKPNPNTFAVVYWRAGLLHYAYVLVTFGKDGKMIARSLITQSGVSEEGVRYSAATIDNDFIVYVAEADSSDSDKMDNKKNFNLEILENGEIIVFNAELN